VGNQWNLMRLKKVILHYLSYSRRLICCLWWLFDICICPSHPVVVTYMGSNSIFWKLSTNKHHSACWLLCISSWLYKFCSTIELYICVRSEENFHSQEESDRTEWFWIRTVGSLDLYSQISFMISSHEKLLIILWINWYLLVVDIKRWHYFFLWKSVYFFKKLSWKT